MPTGLLKTYAFYCCCNLSMYRRIFIASQLNSASIPANPSSRPFSGLALNTSSGCKKASPETVSLSAALSPYPRQAQPPAPCGRFASATLFPRVS